MYKMIGRAFVIVSGGIADSTLELRPESRADGGTRSSLAGIPGETHRARSRGEDHARPSAHDCGLFSMQHHVRQFVVVTSRQHMRRALAVFRAAGFDPVPSVSPLRSDQLDVPPLLLPNDESLMLSNQALYDYVALADYWWRGWLAPASASR